MQGSFNHTNTAPEHVVYTLNGMFAFLKMLTHMLTLKHLHPIYRVWGEKPIVDKWLLFCEH